MSKQERLHEKLKGTKCYECEFVTYDYGLQGSYGAHETWSYDQSSCKGAFLNKDEDRDYYSRTLLGDGVAGSWLSDGAIKNCPRRIMTIEEIRKALHEEEIKSQQWHIEKQFKDIEKQLLKLGHGCGRLMGLVNNPKLISKEEKEKYVERYNNIIKNIGEYFKGE